MALWGIGQDEEDRPKFVNYDNLPLTQAVQNLSDETGSVLQGWNLVDTYTSHDGQTRIKAECLVALVEPDMTIPDDPVDPDDPENP